MIGDSIEHALARIGITSERIDAFLGIPCGCEDRKQRLNAVETWARRVLSGRVADARHWLERIVGGDER